MKTLTPSGNKYILTLIDDYSRYLTTYLLKTKDEVPQKIMDFVAAVKNKFGRAPNIIRSDRGGEYVNDALKKFFCQEGIHHQLTAPHTPEQNGVSERRNRYLLEMVRALLTDSGMSNTYWGEATMTATYLQNRLPTVVRDLTPYELWCGRKPSVKHLRTFGSKAYYHVPKKTRSKLDPCGKEGILMGYCDQSKAYRILDPDTGKIKITRSVTFIEYTSEPKQDLQRLEQTDKSTEVEVVDEHKSDDDEAAASGTPKNTYRRSARTTKGIPPKRYGYAYRAEEDPVIEPTSWEEMLARDEPERIKWIAAAEEEMSSFQEKQVWDLCNLPEGKRAIGCKWVFKAKQNENGQTARFKARLVAKGFSQKPGEDFTETFAPVATATTLRTLLVVAAKKHLNVTHLDVKTAYLHGDIKEELYMEQPEGYVKEGFEHCVLKLKKGLYGLKQGARVWYDTIDRTLKKNGFQQSQSDACLYSRMEQNGTWSYVLVYVDDIIVATSDNKTEEQIVNMLKTVFDIRNLGFITYYLGIQVERDQEGNFHIHQKSKIQQLLQAYNMEDAKAVYTPMEQGYIKDCDQGEILPNNHTFRELIGALLYIAITTRPDIAAAVGILSRKTNRPTSKDWQAIKRVLKYLKTTKDLKLKLGSEDKLEIVGYVDSDWAGDLEDRKSTSGFMFQLGSSIITWSSKKQTNIALSSSEAEYVAASAAARGGVWLLQLLKDFNIDVTQTFVLNEDNQGCLQMIVSDRVKQRSKHIDIKYNHIKQLQEEGIVKMVYCPTEEMKADILTKPLGRQRFENLRSSIGLSKISIEEGCRREQTNNGDNIERN